MYWNEHSRLNSAISHRSTVFFAAAVFILLTIGTGALWALPQQDAAKTPPATTSAQQNAGQQDADKPAAASDSQAQATQQKPGAAPQTVPKGPNETIVVTAPRIEIPLNENPAATDRGVRRIF